MRAIEILGKVQTYSWGKWGKYSVVAKLASGNNNEMEIEDSETYAEFWMGTHPNGPSIVLETKEELKSWIKSNPESLGVAKCVFGEDLSFLFKVLSVNKPLSIQAHPDKVLAKALHEKYPNIYKDSNHKPELAIALTHFEVLVGFRPQEEIKRFFQTVPELRVLAKEDNVLRFIKSNHLTQALPLKDCFSSILTQNADKIKEHVNILLCRLKYSDYETQEAQLYRLVKRLDAEFPGDVGIFAAYLLNHIELKPGQAVFLGANVPHAYLAGDCIECMACSDNVVRVGLTPKLKDVETLTAMLDYSTYKPEDIVFHGLTLDQSTISFAPPIQDFAVYKICINSGCEYKLLTRESASIILVLSGTGTSPDISSPLKLGSVILLPAKQDFTINATSDIVIYQASTNDTLSTFP